MVFEYIHKEKILNAKAYFNRKQQKPVLWMDTSNKKIEAVQDKWK